MQIQKGRRSDGKSITFKNNISIIAVTIIVLAMLLATAMIHLVVSNSKHHTEENISNLQQLLLNSNYQSLQLWKRQLEQQTNSIVSHEEIHILLRGNTNTPLNTANEIHRYLNQNLPANTLNFYIVSNNKTNILSSDISQLGKLNRLLLRQSLNLSDTSNSRPLYILASKIAALNQQIQDNHLFYIRPIWKTSNSLLGLLILEIDLQSALATLANKNTQTPYGSIYLAGQHGALYGLKESTSTKLHSTQQPLDTALISQARLGKSISQTINNSFTMLRWDNELNIGLLSKLTRTDVENLFHDSSTLFRIISSTYILLSIALIIIVFMLNNSKIKLMRTNKKQLEHEIRQRTEELLISNEELTIARNKLDKILESMPDAVITVDQSGKILSFNKSACLMFGYQENEFLDFHIDQLVPQYQREQHYIDRDHFFSKNTGFPSFGAEVTGLHKNGDTFPAAITISAIDIDSTPLAIANIRDITQQKAILKEKSRLQEQLLQGQKMRSMGHLVGGIAHDFNNIITSIKGHNELLLDAIYEKDNTAAKECSNIIETACQHAQKMTSQLLTFGRNQIGKKQPTLINEVIADTLQIALSTIPKQIILINNTPKESIYVDSNVTQLHQALLNLIINARDALDKEGTIEVGLKTGYRHGTCHSCHESYEGNYVELYVKDNGSGIAAEITNNIFEPFYTTKPVGKGNGMGLSMVHGIVHGSLGHISLETDNTGTTFYLLLPVSQATQQSQDKQKQALIPSVDHKYRIMIVDDEPGITRFLEKLFHQAHYDVISFNNAKEALAEIHTNEGRYDAIITDLVMPEMEGLELSQAIFQAFPDIPIILCSGYTKMVNERSIHRFGARTFVTKPFEVPLLLETVSTLIAGRTPTQRNNKQTKDA